MDLNLNLALVWTAGCLCCWIFCVCAFSLIIYCVPCVVNLGWKTIKWFIQKKAAASLQRIWWLSQNNLGSKRTNVHKYLWFFKTIYLKNEGGQWALTTTKGFYKVYVIFLATNKAAKRKKRDYFVIGTLVFRCFVPLANDVITNGSDGCLSLCWFGGFLSLAFGSDHQTDMRHEELSCCGSTPWLTDVQGRQK